MAGECDEPEANGERGGDHQCSAAGQLQGKGGKYVHVALQPQSRNNKVKIAMLYSYFQVEKLVAAKVERVKNYQTLVNFSTKEMKEVNSQPLPLNSTLWRLQNPTC